MRKMKGACITIREGCVCEKGGGLRRERDNLRGGGGGGGWLAKRGGGATGVRCGGVLGNFGLGILHL